MKKLIAMILAAAMLLSLTACGSTAAASSSEQPAIINIDFAVSEVIEITPRIAVFNLSVYT